MTPHTNGKATTPRKTRSASEGTAAQQAATSAVPQAAQPANVAPPAASNGAPSRNGSNGRHAAAQANHKTANKEQSEAGHGAHRPSNGAPSRNGVIGARSKYALMPKCMRPKGVIVPRF